VAQVDYIIAYSCKGNATLGRDDTNAESCYALIWADWLSEWCLTAYAGSKQAASSRLISKQEATVMLLRPSIYTFNWHSWKV
jgi:hypothetical protein